LPDIAPAAFEFLLTPEGQRLLEAGMSSYGDKDPLALASRLRTRHAGASGAQVAAAVSQVVLRHRAVTKFGAASSAMYFTSAGLEQATHPVVAAHRARRLRATGATSCLDLGCGIGSDLIAFARGGLAVTGVDSDQLTCRVAATNLDALGLPGVVTTGQAEDVDLAPYDAVFADPARRTGGSRVFDPRAFSPPWDFIASLLAERPVGRGSRCAVAKLAPGLDHGLVPAHVEAEWVSLEGDLKEVALWAPAPSEARRRATLLDRSGEAHSCTEADSPATASEVRAVGAFVYEPDAAVVRAHLISTVVADVAGWLLDPHIAYVSSDRQVTTAFARTFRVLAVLPFKEKPLRAALRSRGIGVLTIKKRGVAVTPEELRRRLALRGDGVGTLILTRTPRSAQALLVEPVD
jgi:SAM-dependent methyltransferase